MAVRSAWTRPRTTSSRSLGNSGCNGSFAVFKMVETDVVGFENFLQSNKDKIDPELLAAKMCGRWRNGVPLALSPDTDSPPGGIAPEQLNNFEYVNADGSGDPEGRALPGWRPHAPHQPEGTAGRGPRAARRQQQYASADPPRDAVRAGLRSDATARRHRARAARLLHQLEHREPIRVRAEPMGQRRRIRRGGAARIPSRRIR